MTLDEKQNHIIDEFSAYDDWMDKYQYLVELGNNIEPLPEALKTDEHLIVGCQSRVWLTAEQQNGTVIFRGESDAIIVKGIVALLIEVLSGATPDEIIGSDLHFIDEIGLKEHLSPTRSNGLLAMVQQMKRYALAFKNGQNS